jgi:P27 family predicted phage terminase small subunit
MPPRGRPPKPIERKRLTGRTPDTDSGGRPLPAVRAAIVKTEVIPVPPDDLGDRGLTEWGRIWTAGNSWLAPEQDYHWVGMVARAYDDIEQFRVKVKADGLIQFGSMGQVIAHPLIGEIRKCEAVIMKCLSTLGFSPSDRARLGLAEVQTASKLQQMMKGT